jgi:hypothetical protein
MAHFAQMDENNKVLRVIVINNDDIDNLPFPESEPIGQTFIASIGLDGQWLQTSYSSSFRNKFAGIGDFFEQETQNFVSVLPPAS